MPQHTQHLYEFGPFRLDPAQQLLTEGKQKVPLTPKAFQTLLVLVENHGRVLGKDELLTKVWPDVFVEEATLAQNVFTLRKQLGDDRETALYIETVPKRGYRFVANVLQIDPAAEKPVVRPRLFAPILSIVVGALALLVVLGGLAWRNWNLPSSAPGFASGNTSQPAVAVRKLAVLPFRELSRGSGEESWGIGMSDAIITRLAGLQSLAVRPTSSVLKYAKEPADPGKAAGELGVDSVLDGTYQRVGETMRVSVQLIDKENQATRWAERYDLNAKNMLNFQDEVARKVVEGLRLQVSPRERKILGSSRTSSAEAYNRYLLGRIHKNEYFMHTRLASLREGQSALRQAAMADPSFADAYALLGLMHLYESANYAANGAQNLKDGEKAARRALELDPSSVEGSLALGLALTEGGRNSEAITKLREAVRLSPNSESGWDLLGYVYHYAGLDDLAEEAYRRSLELDPTTPRIYWMHGRMLLYVGRVQEAEQEMRQALAIHPDHFKVLTFLGEFLYYQGKLDEAEPFLRRAVELGRGGGDDTPLLAAGFLYAARGQRDHIDPAVFRLQPSQVVDGDQAYWTGGVYALLGEKQNALAWLRRAVELGNHNYPWFERDKNYDKFRSDPDYRVVMDEVRRHWEQYRKDFASN
jgi:DNA-binding winged helix-turn-helix (wHTH) protein/TolB-like protein/Tfp pilus assembly protein PilF